LIKIISFLLRNQTEINKMSFLEFKKEFINEANTDFICLWEVIEQNKFISEIEFGIFWDCNKKKWNASLINYLAMISQK